MTSSLSWVGVMEAKHDALAHGNARCSCFMTHKKQQVASRGPVLNALQGAQKASGFMSPAQVCIVVCPWEEGAVAIGCRMERSCCRKRHLTRHHGKVVVPPSLLWPYDALYKRVKHVLCHVLR